MATDWTLGHDLSALRRGALIFRAAFWPYIRGAFGLPKEQDCQCNRR
jgi:hypothetical protein